MIKEVIKLVTNVGEYIKQESRNFNHSSIEIKEFNNLVSYVDRKAEEQLVEGLKRILPTAGFITEENTIDQSPNELQWIIDPLDGTTNFSHGIPAYAISTALAK